MRIALHGRDLLEFLVKLFLLLCGLLVIVGIFLLLSMFTI